MQNKLISGKALSNQILNDIQLKLDQGYTNGAQKAGLAVVLVGDNEASKVYVNNKKNACSKIGITSYEHKLDGATTQEQLLDLINQLNQDPCVHGILVQLPLPKHIDPNVIIDAINPNKDVDGFHRYNIGSLAINNQTLSPCTPQGVIYMLDSINFNYRGSHAVVLGSSNIVGRPMALELLNRKATVTICNSQTRDIKDITSLADVLVVAVGKPNLVDDNWIKPGAVVIDVGINRNHEGKLCGDVNLDALINKVKYISPVPGGVGPLTIAMLMQNAYTCYSKSQINKTNLI